MDIVESEAGILFIIATPIGNLEDITLRAIRILKEVDLVAAEDTRRTKKLLNFYGISTPLISLHEHNEMQKSSMIVSKIKSGMQVAYVTDAGTPCISDPGYRLVRSVQAENLRVIPVPGPSAIIAALSASGLPSDNFIFCGFLPAKGNKRREILEELKNEEKTIIFYESPNRFQAALLDMRKVLGDRELVVARELTKVFEEIRHGKISDILKENIQSHIKGEFTLILKGQEKKKDSMTDEEVGQKLVRLLGNEKMSLRDAVNAVVEQTGLPKKKVYNLALKFQS